MGWICSRGFRVDEGSLGGGGSLGLGSKGKEGTLARWVELPITGEGERAQSSDTNILLFRLKSGEMRIYIITSFLMLEGQHFCTSFLISTTEVYFMDLLCFFVIQGTEIW